MKQIIVKKCRYCPYMGQRHGELYCKKIAEAHQNEMGLDDIHKDCPLTELPSKEEAIKEVASVLKLCLEYDGHDYQATNLAKTIVGKLGFKEGV